MGRFDSRMKKLVRDTHEFVSHAELCLVRDYLFKRFEEIELPADFDDRFEELEQVNVKLNRVPDSEATKRFYEILGSSEGFRLKSLQPFYRNLCEKCPSGLWIQCSESKNFRRYIDEAKEYFRGKRGN